MKLGLLVAAFACAAHGQPTFDVASVKVNSLSRDPDALSFSDVKVEGPGRVRAINANLRECVQWAWELGDDQLSGPAWFNDHRPSFDIEAKAPPDTPAPELRRMMQTLLIERFRLKLRRETKVVPVFELVLANGGPKLQPIVADPPAGVIASGGGRMWGGAVTARRLARALRTELKRPVFDKTGIEQTFSFRLDYAQEGDTGSGRPSLFTAVEQALGLKLTSAKAPIEHLTVERAERMPTEN